MIICIYIYIYIYNELAEMDVFALAGLKLYKNVISDTEQYKIKDFEEIGFTF